MKSIQTIVIKIKMEQKMVTRILKIMQKMK